MKEGIHPNYEMTTITCACGEVIHTRSTKKSIRVEICSKCHPLYTGKQRVVDTARRVNRFEKRVEAQSASAAKTHGKRVKQELRKAKKLAKATEAETPTPITAQ